MYFAAAVEIYLSIDMLQMSGRRTGKCVRDEIHIIKSYKFYLRVGQIRNRESFHLLFMVTYDVSMCQRCGGRKIQKPVDCLASLDNKFQTLPTVSTSTSQHQQQTKRLWDWRLKVGCSWFLNCKVRNIFYAETQNDFENRSMRSTFRFSLIFVMLKNFFVESLKTTMQ